MNLIGARAHDYGRDTPINFMQRIASDDWQTIQLAFTKSVLGVNTWADVSEQHVAAVQQALQKTKMHLAVLGVYIEPSLMDEATRNESVRIFKSQLAVAKRLGAGCIGTETTNMNKQPAGTTREQAMLRLERSLAEILPEAEALGVTVAVEPVYYHAMATPELTRRVLNTMASPNLKVIFDPGNLFSPEEAANQQQIWERAFDAFGDEIVAMHMKGVRIENGQPQSCLLEQSQVDYKAVYALLAQSKSVPPILREEAVPARAKSDRAFIEALLAESGR